MRRLRTAVASAVTSIMSEERERAVLLLQHGPMSRMKEKLLMRWVQLWWPMT